MSIPFIQGLAGGERVGRQIPRPMAIEKLGAEFIHAAGRYLLEVQPNGMVKLMAIIDTAEGCTEVATEITENNTKLPEAVDRLVLESVLHIPFRKSPIHVPGIIR